MTTKMFSGMVLLMALALAACGEPEQGLTGANRTAFVSGIVAPCSKDGDVLGRMHVPPDQVDAYCTCVGNRLADHASNDIVRDVPALEAAVKPYMPTALAACRNESWSK